MKQGGRPAPVVPPLRAANAVVVPTGAATALVVGGRLSPACTATVSVANCDDTAGFREIPCDVSFGVAYDVNSAGNS